MTVDDLIAFTHTQVLNARNLQYFIESKEFQDIYVTLKTQERGEVILMIMKNNLDALRAWYEKKKPRQLEEYTVAELRAIARKLDIKGYHLMTKIELLGTINERRMQEMDKRNGTPHPGVGEDKDLESLTFLG